MVSALDSRSSKTVYSHSASLHPDQRQNAAGPVTCDGLASIPSRGSSNTPNWLHAIETGISSPAVWWSVWPECGLFMKKKMFNLSYLYIGIALILATCISWVAGLNHSRSGHSSTSLGVVRPHSTKLKISRTMFCRGIATIRKDIHQQMPLNAHVMFPLD